MGTIRISNELQIPLVATSDTHYADREDSDSQDLMLCVNMGKRKNDPNRMQFESDEFFLRSPMEMYDAFPNRGDAVARSQEIADSCDVSIPLGRRFFPVFKNEDPTQTLETKCQEGYFRNTTWGPSDAEKERLAHELSIIDRMGFTDYFLILHDLVREANDRGIPCGARGSAVGSFVAYCLGLTNINPLDYGLLFERFLDPSRNEAPDIDIDFCKERRHEIIEYCRDRYGKESVAHIGTFGTMGLRASIRDAARVLGVSREKTDRITQALPRVPQYLQHLRQSIGKAKAEAPALLSLYENDDEVREVLDAAEQLEGKVRHFSTHAAAVVIGDRPLTEFLPLCKPGGKGELTTQWAMDDVEAAGLLKMDFLGLKNLTMVAKIEEMIPNALADMKLDDAATLRLFQEGHTTGVFQMESEGIRSWMVKLQPDCFEDIIALNALYRPGPLMGGMVDEYIDVKHGRKAASYAHPILEEILKETHGVMVYQEQVMLILHRLGGIDLSAAYTCIKAISKKKEKVIAENKEQFMAGGNSNAVEPEVLERLWSQIMEFAGYGFNKSHSTAYAHLAFTTAYLKAHYPTEFMAALLTMDLPHRNLEDLRKDKMIPHLHEVERMDIEVEFPCVNKSGTEFEVHDGTIVFPLTMIKGCKDQLHLVKEARKAGGPFTSLDDFCVRVPVNKIRKSVVINMINAGAMDCLSGTRSQKVATLPAVLKRIKRRAKDKERGQTYLFAVEGEVLEDTAFEPAKQMTTPERLDREYKLLGFTISSHLESEHYN